MFRDSPGSLVVKISKGGNVSLIPGHASWPKHQTLKKKQYCKEFIEDFDNGPHQKKKIFFFFKKRIKHLKSKIIVKVTNDTYSTFSNHWSHRRSRQKER